MDRMQATTANIEKWSMIMFFSLYINLIEDTPINIKAIHSKHYHSWCIKIFDWIDYFTRQDIGIRTKNKGGVQASCRCSSLINIVETDMNAHLVFV